MADDLSKIRDPELLPVRQRIAWMALVWSLSVLFMVSLTWAIQSAF